MKPVKQTIIGDNGNCLQACVASLFELELEEVPHFISYGDDWWFVYKDFLAERNITVTYSFNFVPVGSYYIASVKSPRFKDGTHAVICGPDGTIIHDPCPGVDDYSINGKPIGYHWYNVADPGKMISN